MKTTERGSDKPKFRVTSMLRMLGFLCLASVSLSVAISLGCSSGGPNRSGNTPEELHNGLTKQQAAQVLIKVGTTTITVGEFADRLANESPYLRARYNSPERRREYLDTMVRFELLAAEAHRRGFDANDEVVRTRKQMMIQELMKREFEDRIQLTDISDADVQAYYNAHPDEYNKPEQVRASHIVIRNRAAAQRALTQILAHADDVAFFREQAERLNEDAETRDRFGDLRFFSRPDQRTSDEPAIPAAVATAAFSIAEVGGVHAQLVESPAGFHIIKLTAKRAAMHRTLEEVSRPIRQRLWRERREQAINDFVTRLRTEAHVVEHLDVLNDLHIDIPTGEVPTMPGAPPGMPMPGMPGIPGMPGAPGMPPGATHGAMPGAPHGAPPAPGHAGHGH